MKIIVVHVGDVIYCPPALNIIQGLLDLGHEIVLCSTISKADVDSKFNGKITLRHIEIDYEVKISKKG